MGQDSDNGGSKRQRGSGSRKRKKKVKRVRQPTSSLNKMITGQGHLLRHNAPWVLERAAQVVGDDG